MRQIKLSLLFICISFWFMPEADADNHRLWIEQSAEDGGELKDWMINEKLANEEGFTCGALLQAAWKIAEAREIAATVNRPSAQAEFTQLLANWFFTTSTLPCASLETELTWAQFGEIGRAQGGYPPFDSEVVQQAIMTAEANAEAKRIAQAKAEQAEARERGLIYHVPELPTEATSTEEPAPAPVPVVSNTEGNTSETLPLALEVFQGSESVGVLDLRPVKRRSPADLLAQLEADAKAEREEAEAEARIVEAERLKQQRAEEREEELERLRHEIAKKNFMKQLDASLVEPQSSRSRSNRQVSLRSSNFQTGSGSSSPQSHTEAFLKDYFHDIPVMVEIARCESGFENVQSGLRYRNGTRRGQQERSFGFFQIHEPDWHDEAIRLGLENYQTDGMQNVLMARHVLKKQGFQAWERCSKQIGLL